VDLRHTSTTHPWDFMPSTSAKIHISCGRLSVAVE
jgi:hypothetical protein